MLLQSWCQSQLQVEEPKSAIKHGGPGKTFISIRQFTEKSMLQQSWPVAAASGRAQKCYQTQGSGKNFHFHLGVYLKIDAAAIVAPVAAASGRAPKCYKTQGSGKHFHFHLGIYLKIESQKTLGMHGWFY